MQAERVNPGLLMEARVNKFHMSYLTQFITLLCQTASNLDPLV